MMAANLPLVGSRCYVKSGEGRVVDIQLLQQSATVRLKQDGRIMNVMRSDLFDNEELIDSGGCGTGDGAKSTCGTGSCH